MRGYDFDHGQWVLDKNAPWTSGKTVTRGLLLYYATSFYDDCLIDCT